LRELFYSNARYIYRKSHTTAEVHRQEVSSFDRDGVDGIDFAQVASLIGVADMAHTGIV
jgi:hypothetical protein